MIAEAAKLYTQFQDDRPRRAKNFWSALVCIPAACLLASLRVAWTSAAGPPGDARLLARGDGALAGEPLGLFLEFGASGLNDLGLVKTSTAAAASVLAAVIIPYTLQADGRMLYLIR